MPLNTSGEAISCEKDKSLTEYLYVRLQKMDLLNITCIHFEALKIVYKSCHTKIQFQPMNTQECLVEQARVKPLN